MKRTGVFLAVILLAIGTTARASELDNEFGTRAKAIPTAYSVVAPASPGTELDAESPAQSCFFGWGLRRPFFGFGGFGYGYPGFGFGGFGYGFGYRPFGFGGFGYGYPGFGFGGFGYRPFGFGGFGGFGFRRGFWW